MLYEIPKFGRKPELGCQIFIYLGWKNALMVREITSKVFCCPHMVRVRDHDFPGVFEVLVRSCPTTPLFSSPHLAWI